MLEGLLDRSGTFHIASRPSAQDDRMSSVRLESEKMIECGDAVDLAKGPFKPVSDIDEKVTLKKAKNLLGDMQDLDESVPLPWCFVMARSSNLNRLSPLGWALVGLGFRSMVCSCEPNLLMHNSIADRDSVQRILLQPLYPFTNTHFRCAGSFEDCECGIDL